MIHTSAPGTLMLMGEHAVLHGKHCLVAATDQRLQVRLTPRQDQQIQIHSALGQLSTSLDHLEVKAPFTFVLAAIKNFKPKTGFDLEIQSDFTATVGLGSSAAVLIATTLALHALDSKANYNDKKIFDLAYQSLIEVQGRGSGADLAASILGGIVRYCQKPFSWQKLNLIIPEITLVYSGYKTATPEVIQIVEAARQQAPQQYERIFTKMDKAVMQAEVDFNSSFTACQHLMQALGVVDQTLQKIVDLFAPTPAKVSGSGLGDCVIGLGKYAKIGDYQIIPAQLATEGMLLHAR